MTAQSGGWLEMQLVGDYLFPTYISRREGCLAYRVHHV